MRVGSPPCEKEMKAIDPMLPSIGSAIIRVFDVPSGFGSSGGGCSTSCPPGGGCGGRRVACSSLMRLFSPDSTTVQYYEARAPRPAIDTYDRT
ncbi:hypothetical protein GCM10022202_20210 [Microbacterium marinilacus]|uniref:Uncharacterized protein n=1 Tax=Microbacterium marinilacus TaxID=415209 RepID=A0ABP7BHN2_9MICO